jgi:rhodanese-related sulfurtransferase
VTIKRVAPDEAQRMVQDEDYVYLDVRSVREFDAGHPQGAYNIPFLKATPAGLKPNLAFIQDVSKHFGVEDKIVVGCKSGGRSAQAGTALASVGFTAVVDLAGGYDAWVPGGHPVSKGAAGRSYSDLVSGDD